MRYQQHIIDWLWHTQQRVGCELSDGRLVSFSFDELMQRGKGRVQLKYWKRP